MVIEPVCEVRGESAEGLMGYKPLSTFWKRSRNFPQKVADTCLNR